MKNKKPYQGIIKQDNIQYHYFISHMNSTFNLEGSNFIHFTMKNKNNIIEYWNEIRELNIENLIIKVSLNIDNEYYLVFNNIETKFYTSDYILQEYGIMDLEISSNNKLTYYFKYNKDKFYSFERKLKIGRLLVNN